MLFGHRLIQVKRFFLLGFFIFIFFAGVSEKVKIEGVVVSYNEDTVVLSQKNRGVNIEVPLNSIPLKLKLRTGQKVYAFIKSSDLKTLRIYKD